MNTYDICAMGASRRCLCPGLECSRALLPDDFLALKGQDTPVLLDDGQCRKPAHTLYVTNVLSAALGNTRYKYI